jgi:hypothetical protein
MNKNNYDFNEINKRVKGKSNSLDELFFELKLFNRMKNIYFKRTPESDSLYRRRNRLIILASSCLFYWQTNKYIFEKYEMVILTTSKSTLNKLVIFKFLCRKFLFIKVFTFYVVFS